MSDNRSNASGEVAMPEEQAPSSGRRPHPSVWFALLLVAVLAVMVSLGVFAQWLRDMHGPGLSALAPEQGLAHGAGTAAKAAGSWHAFDDLDRANDLYRSPGAVLALFLWVDTLAFVPLYFVAGWLALGRGGAWALGQRPQAERARAAVLFRAARYALAGTAILDLGENVLIWFVFRAYWDPPGSPRLAWVLQWLSLAKWLLGGFVVLALLLLVFIWLRERHTEAGTTLRLVRVQAIGVAILAFGLFMKMQVPDTILTWNVGHYVAVLVLTLLLALTQWALSQHALDRAAERQSRRREANETIPRRFWLWGLAAVVASVVFGIGTGLAHDKTFGTAASDAFFGAGLVGVAAAAVLLISWLVGAWAPTVAPADEADVMVAQVAVPWYLAVAVPVIVGLATLRVALGPYVLTGGHQARRVLGAVVLLLAGPALGWALGPLDQWARHHGRPGTAWWHGRRWLLTRLCGAGGALVAVACVLWRFTVPRWLSAVGVMLTFLIVLTFVAGLLVVVAEWASTRYYLPALFRLLRVRRLPVFTIVAVWSVLAASFDSGAHWEVRRLHVTSRPAPLTLGEAFDAWVAAHQPRVTAPGFSRPAVPLVIVAASGGGIRAATWTALAVRCLFEGQGGGHCDDGGAAKSDELFLASGISGGSVGLTEYVAHLTAPDDPPDGDWVDQHLRGDFVSPQLAWQLFVETPRSLLHFGADDRAEVLERTFEREWPASDALAQGLLTVQGDPDRLGRLPLLLLNGASVTDGCWIATSALRTSWRPDPKTETPGTCLPYEPSAGAGTPEGVLPASVDVNRYLCDTNNLQDLRLSTAGFLSARFPFVSPAGRLNRCQDEDGGRTADSKYVLDGGDIEASASENALALYAALRDRIADHNRDPKKPCVVPFFVQIDNGYATSVEPGPVAPPNQLAAPLASVLSGRDARPERDRAASYLEFRSPLPGMRVTAGGKEVTTRYARLVPVAHPGNQPTLGWALSDQSQDDLRDQLASEQAQAVVSTVRNWLTADLRCSTPDAYRWVSFSP